MPKQRRISWRHAARQDLAAIVDHISEDSPKAADGLPDAIERALDVVARFPMIFRESERMPGTHEVPVFGSFLLFYRVHKDTVDIIGITHGRRNFPITDWKDR